MTLPTNYCRVAIVGASSLRGKDLATAIEERGFPATDVRLLDDEVVDGTLVEAGGEPSVIQGVDEESFDGVRFTFFAGSAELTARHWHQAARSGSTVIDLGGPLADEPGAAVWIPALRKTLPPSQPAGGKLFYSPPAPALVASTFAVALREIAHARTAFTFFRPVSEHGQDGIDDLENQTVNLLSMKPVSAGVYDAQVAFNLLVAYGDECRTRLPELSARASRDVKKYLADRIPAPAIQFIQAPVFYGYAFSAFIEAERVRETGELDRALETAGIRVATTVGDSPTNVSIAGESQIHAGPATRDGACPHSYWIWGAADNLRLATANAISIAETLLAS